MLDHLLIVNSKLQPRVVQKLVRVEVTGLENPSEAVTKEGLSCFYKVDPWGNSNVKKCVNMFQMVSRLIMIIKINILSCLPA